MSRSLRRAGRRRGSRDAGYRTRGFAATIALMAHRRLRPPRCRPTPAHAPRVAAASTPRTAPSQTPVFMPVGTRGDRQGRHDAAAATSSARRSCSPTPTTCSCAPGPTSCATRAGCTAFMNWDRADPHRLRRLPDLQPRRHAQAHRRRRARSARSSTARSTSGRPRTTCASRRTSAPTSSCSSTSARRTPPRRRSSPTAVRRSAEWAARCKAAHTREDQALFGIVQGGVFDDLRAGERRAPRRARLARATGSAATRWASRTS